MAFADMASGVESGPEWAAGTPHFRVFSPMSPGMRLETIHPDDTTWINKKTTSGAGHCDEDHGQIIRKDGLDAPGMLHGIGADDTAPCGHALQALNVADFHDFTALGNAQRGGGRADDPLQHTFCR